MNVRVELIIHRGDPLDVSIPLDSRVRPVGPEKGQAQDRCQGQGDENDREQASRGAGKLDAAGDLTALAVAVGVAVMTGDAGLLG